MNDNQVKRATRRKFETSHKLRRDYPDTYPHVETYTVNDPDWDRNEITVTYVVSNGWKSETVHRIYSL